MKDSKERTVTEDLTDQEAVDDRQNNLSAIDEMISLKMIEYVENNTIVLKA